MKILMLNDQAPDSNIGSGAERFITLLIEGLVEIGHEVDFMSFTSRLPSAESIEDYDVVHVHNYNMASMEIQKVLMETKVPVIFTVHDYLYLCKARHGLSHKGHPCPFVGEDRSICDVCIPHGQRLVDGLFESARVIVADSEMMAEILQRHLPDCEVRSILLGVPVVDLRMTDHVVRNSFLFMGRHSIEKGFAEMIAAFKSFNVRYPDSRLIITHGGHGEGLLKVLVNRAGLADSIVITGKLKREELHRHIDECVAVLAPSIWEEPFNLTIPEAWLHGRAVIASDIGAHTELLFASGGGLLYPPWDTEEFASLMEMLYIDQDLADMMGQRGYEAVVDYFNQHRMVRDYDFLYKELVA